MEVYTGELKARIVPTNTGRIWTFALFNDEAAGGPNQVSAMHLSINTPFTVVTTPPGWAFDTDNSKFILWYTLNQQFSIPPGGSLSIFSLETTTDLALPPPFTLTSWNYQSNQAGPVIIGGFSAVIATAATASISGRVVGSNKRGLSRAVVTMTDPNGQVRSAMTNFSGYYRFSDVMVGETYIFAISSKNKSTMFAPQVVFITEDRSDLNFHA